MMAMRPRGWILATIFAGAVALSAGPARAGPVRDAVASLKDALADIGTAQSFFSSESDPSILSGLAEYSSALSVRPEKVLNRYVRTTTASERRLTLRAMSANLLATTRGSRSGLTLRDLFYIEFVGSIRRLTGDGGLRERLASLFVGTDISSRLIDRYRLAVSRTR